MTPRRRTRGRAVAAEEIVDAAARLFASRGPTSVSLREVAAEADVNTGLIHHYIGNKDDLLTAVLERGSGRAWAEMDEQTLARTLAEIVAGGDPDDRATINTMVQIRTILAGLSLREHQSTFPLVEDLYARLRERTSVEEAQVTTAIVAAAAAGWIVVGPVALAAIGGEALDPTFVADVLARALTKVMAVTEGSASGT